MTLNANGSFSYTPTAAYTGPDSFTYHANDGSLNSNVVTVTLTVTATATNNGVQLDGSSQYITFGAAPSLGVTSFTLETWFMRTGAGHGVTTGTNGIASAIPLITKGGAEAETPANVNMNYFLGIDASTGQLVADFEEAAGPNHPVTGVAVVTSNVWHHVAATYDATTGTWKLYLDGVLDKTLALGSAFQPQSASIQHAALGTSLTSTGAVAQAPNGGFFAGVLDEARIWNVVRTAAQIAAAKNSELTSGTGLIGRWGLNEGSGTNAANSISGGVAGTLVGTPSWVAGFVPPAGNTAPVAVADTYSTPLNTALTVAAPGVLVNDTDAESNPLTAVLNTTVGHGSLTLNANGSFSYTPTAAYTGPDSFTYHANDGSLNSNVVTVSLTVSLTNTAPVAVADTYSTPLNTALTVATPGVLANDTDAESNPLTAVLNTTVGHGTLTLNANGSFSYTPTAAYTGPDSFTYHANDGSLNSNVVTVSLTVTATATNNGVQLNGSSQYITFGPAPGLNASTYTLETWFKRTGAGVGTSTGNSGIASAIPLITKGRAEAETPANLNMNYFLGIDATSGQLVADFEDTVNGGNHPVTGVAVVTSNVWHHVAATYGAGTWNLYLDGVLDKTLAVGAFTPEATSIQHAALGTAMTSTGVAAGFFAGVLDEARIWNVVRTAAQIAAAKNSELTSGTGLIGRWGLNEGSGTNAANSISGGVAGTLVGTPSWVAGFVP